MGSRCRWTSAAKKNMSVGAVGLLVVALAGGACQWSAAHAGATPGSPLASITAATPTVGTPSAPGRSAIAAWRTFVNVAGGYSLQYPDGWYQIPDPNMPNDYAASFSNEDAGYWPRTTPQIGTPDNVFLTVLRSASRGTCAGPTSYVTLVEDTTLDGAPAQRYVVDRPPAWGDPDPLHRIVLVALHEGYCWLLSFDSRTRAARDSNAALADQIIAGFRFLGTRPSDVNK